MRGRLVFESVRRFTIEEINKVLPYDAASYTLQGQLRELTVREFVPGLRRGDLGLRGFAQHKGEGFLWGICFLEVGTNQWLPVSHFIFCESQNDQTARNCLKQTIKDLMSLSQNVVLPDEQAYSYHAA
jgi:hypothetical protein